MGIDKIEILKPPEFRISDLPATTPMGTGKSLHNPETCGGQGICLTCSVRAYLEIAEA